MRKNNKLLNLILVVSALLATTPKTKAQEKGISNFPSFDMPVNVNIEKTESNASFGEITLKPGMIWQKDDLSLEARWNAYRSGTSDGNVSDWATTRLNAEVKYKDWILNIGKRGFNSPYAAFLAFPRTPTMDNNLVIKGDNVCFSGIHLQEAKSGLGIGLVRKDTEVSLEHLDDILINWQKDFGAVGATVYAAINEHNIDRAGATVFYHPTEKTTVVADWIYKDKQHNCIIGARQQISDKLGISVVGELMDVNASHASPTVSVSCDYEVNKNCSVIVVGNHDFRNKDTCFGVALKLSGILEHTK